jgi:DNA-binding CsgD family transcriptional regulator
MPRLEHKNLTAVSEALLSLYAPGPYADFPARVCATVHHCLPSDCLAYHEIIDNQNQRAFFFPKIPFDTQIFETYLDQHPTWNAFAKDHMESSVKISDFISRDGWQRTDLYNHIFRPLTFDHQLAFITLGELPQLGVALNRSGMDFSEEERSILNVLKPHLFQAFTTSRLFSYFSDAADAVNHGYVVADRRGRILFATTKAIGWLEEYFGQNHNTSLPGILRDWLQNRSLKLFNTDNLGDPLKQLSFRFGSKRLTVESLSPIQGPDHRLVLSEVDDGLDAKPLEVLGITKREAEVLLWVSQGKRNAEIAIILGVKAKTITKHLERVFEKLGVETRTSAANIALDCLRRST